MAGMLVAPYRTDATDIQQWCVKRSRCLQLIGPGSYRPIMQMGYYLAYTGRLKVLKEGPIHCGLPEKEHLGLCSW